MRKATRLGLLGVTALGLGSVAVVPGVFAPTAAAQAREPLCRRAAALPALPPETRVRDDDQQRTPPSGMPVPMEAPVMSAPPAPPPPVPMPMPEAMYEPGAADSSSGEDMIVTGSRVRGSAKARPSMPLSTADDYVAEARIAPGHHRPPGPRPQSGLLTAGDHDDLLNPELYASYAGNYLQNSHLRDLPKLDTRRVLTVAVQDGAGRPVPFARVTLTCADGNSLSLATVADGTAVFYPGLDRLGRSVRLSVPGAAGSRPSPSPTGAGAQRQGITLRSGAAPIRKFDLLLVRSTRPEAWATRSTI